MKTKLVLVLISAVCLFVQTGVSEDQTVIRFGHFPNITHAQGVIAHALSRQGKGWFEQRLGPNVKIQWFTYNAGPSAMEAIFAGSLDLTYVGQGPALNAHFKSNGEEIRVLGGAATAGAALVVKRFAHQNGGGLSRKEDRDSTAWQYPGHFLSCLAEGAGIQGYPNRW